MSAPEQDLEALVAGRMAGQKSALRGAIFAAVAAALAATLLLGLSGWFLTGAGLAGLAGGGAVLAFNYLVPSAFIRLSAVARTGGRYFERLLSHRAALRTLAAVRVDLMAQVAALDPRRARVLSNGEAAARLTGDVDALEDRIVRTPARPAALASAAFALLLAGAASPWAVPALAALFLTLPPAVAAVARWRVDAPAEEAQRLLGQLKAEMADMLAAGPEIAVYGLAAEAAGRLQRTAAQMDMARRRAASGTALATGLLTAAGPLMAALVLLLGTGSAPLVAAAALAVLAACEILGGPIRARLEESRTRTGLRQLEALAAQAADAPAKSLPAASQPQPLAIDALRLIPGDRLALTGRSGSGKTRILESFAGLRADAPQALRVGGEDPRALAFADLSRQFALSPQDPVLIAGTVADNLRLARPGLTEEALWAALETACLADEVRALPEGLLTWLGDGGARLSGGQRKRLALARALLAGRPWLLLDEPSEGLDSRTEAELARRLGEWLSATGAGALIASHRPAIVGLAGRCLNLG
ncbi:ATP-binding cassette domain-containing protein [Sandaracinobacter sp. RS1-74]|uniref:ATP-binding cassette domain-containing protein n=1 Tax=Sandaracinobacteroides sayramensis TaxID=2913411 RepID=UPI001EDBDB0F|nr:ATP-binding cassette domain-containing protein [Sandaracinobacteroides sayramensis]MCG2839735.1 ATP-binding cassette domain-containing protein [Sandaracinobacteroides sayramensis]